VEPRGIHFGEYRISRVLLDIKCHGDLKIKKKIPHDITTNNHPPPAQEKNMRHFGKPNAHPCMCFIF